MATPHIELNDKSKISKTVLMPGDPLRALFIAKTYLKDYIQINSVRNMLGFSGYYKDKFITVMGSGMGMPSIGIYSYELFKFYDVENIIRVGSCGSYSPNLKLYDVILVDKAYSESSYAKTFGLTDDEFIESSSLLNEEIIKSASKLNIDLNFGNIHSSDVFYRLNGTDYQKLYNEYNLLGVEMESFALFANAKALNKNASCLLTVSDSFVTKEETSSLERQNSFTKMMEIALNID